jgi:hypothetical protein
MWKDPNLILDYASFWSQKALFSDYVIPAVPESSLSQYEKGLQACIPRIEGCRTRERAAQIICTLKVIIHFQLTMCVSLKSLVMQYILAVYNLQKVIADMKVQQVHKYKWNKILYRAPPVVRPQDLTVSEEELARVENICMDEARKRLAGESSVRTERILSAIEIGDYLVISAPNDVPEPFYIAQVALILLVCMRNID